MLNTTIAPTPIAISTKANPKSQRYRLLPRNAPIAAKPLPGKITNDPSNGSMVPASIATPPATNKIFATHVLAIIEPSFF
jgi:hypothetical protein